MRDTKSGRGGFGVTPKFGSRGWLTERAAFLSVFSNLSLTAPVTLFFKKSAIGEVNGRMVISKGSRGRPVVARDRAMLLSVLSTQWPQLQAYLPSNPGVRIEVMFSASALRMILFIFRGTCFPSNGSHFGVRRHSRRVLDRNRGDAGDIHPCESHASATRTSTRNKPCMSSAMCKKGHRFGIDSADLVKLRWDKRLHKKLAFRSEKRKIASLLVQHQPKFLTVTNRNNKNTKNNKGKTK